MEIISRAAWGARAPRNRSVTTWARRTEVIVHHSEGPTNQTVRSIQDFHMDPAPRGRGWSDIGYNFLVDDAGRIYEGRGWLVVGAHATDHNTSGIGVCYLGRNAPTAAAKRSIRAVYDEACRRAGRTLARRGHGQVNATSCPGSNLQAWVRAGMPAGGAPAPSDTAAPAWPGRVLRVTDPLMRGDDVRTWQRRMGERGWTLAADGIFGQASRRTAMLFQTEKKLPRTGEVDRATWTATWKSPIT